MTMDSQVITVLSSKSKTFEIIKQRPDYITSGKNAYSFDIKIDNLDKFKFLMLDIYPSVQVEEINCLENVLRQIRMHDNNDLFRYEAEILLLVYILYSINPKISLTCQYMEELKIKAEEIYGSIYPSKMKALKMYTVEYDCNKLYCIVFATIVCYLIWVVLGMFAVGLWVASNYKFN